MSQRVRIGTCTGPADAALVRSMFLAHGVDVVIGAENHAGMLAGLGAGFLSLDIWVDDEISEEATALLRDLRDGDSRVRATTDASTPSADDDDYDGVEDGSSWPPEQTSTIDQRTDRRRRTAVALLLGCCVTFGTVHMFSGAWARGFLLAAVEVFGILQADHRLGPGAAIAAIVVDLAGGMWRVRVAPPRLPPARLHSA